MARTRLERFKRRRRLWGARSLQGDPWQAAGVPLYILENPDPEQPRFQMRHAESGSVYDDPDDLWPSPDIEVVLIVASMPVPKAKQPLWYRAPYLEMDQGL